MKNTPVRLAAVAAVILASTAAAMGPSSDKSFETTLREIAKAALAKPGGAAVPAAPLPARPDQEDPCAQNKELEKRQFRLQLVSPKDVAKAVLQGVQDAAQPGPAAGAVQAAVAGRAAQPFAVTFRYAGECTVIDRDYDGDPVTPVASRRFSGDNGGYDLYIQTELDAKSSSVALTQSPDGPGTFLNAASLPDKDNRLLAANGTLELGSISIADYRGRYSKVSGLGTLESSAAGR